MNDTPRTNNLARGNHVVPTEFAEELEQECNLLRKALEKISMLSQTTCLSFEAQSFKATSIACFALADAQKLNSFREGLDFGKQTIPKITDEEWNKMSIKDRGKIMWKEIKNYLFFLKHDLFGWHNNKGSNEEKFDGCSFHSVCSCGKKVMQDSQGNWF